MASKTSGEMPGQIHRLRVEREQPEEIMEVNWQPIKLAPDGEVVLTKIDDENGERNVQRLKRKGRLWFTPDEAMYVYYTPTHFVPSNR